MSRLVFALAGALVIAGCGAKVPLRPAAGERSPPAPLMAAKAPTPDEMVQPTPEQRPARVDEPLTKSEKRDPDPFDLPPPG